MVFYVGLHQPQHAKFFDRCMISVNVIRKRKSGFAVNDWIMDSGAFTQISRNGKFLETPEEYAGMIDRWSSNGNLLAACSQDFMCERFILDVTGKTIPEHQQMTIERYDRILAAKKSSTHLLPVLQGYEPEDYVRHIEMYQDRLTEGMWVGVGSVCKRNVDTFSVERVLGAVKKSRPDLRLHGFGIKTTALGNYIVRELLHTSDSMAWSFAARKAGRDANSWHEAKSFVEKVERIEFMPYQARFFGEAL